MESSPYKCKTCGEEFSGGRMLGNHYTENPSHRPPTKPRGDRAGKPGAASPKARPIRTLSATDLIGAAIDKLAVEINTKRQMLADVERLKAEITQLENQRVSLQKMLAPAKTL